MFKDLISKLEASVLSGPLVGKNDGEDQQSGAVSQTKADEKALLGSSEFARSYICERDANWHIIRDNNEKIVHRYVCHAWH